MTPLNRAGFQQWSEGERETNPFADSPPEEPHGAARPASTAISVRQAQAGVTTPTVRTNQMTTQMNDRDTIVPPASATSFSEPRLRRSIHHQSRGASREPLREDDTAAPAITLLSDSPVIRPCAQPAEPSSTPLPAPSADGHLDVDITDSSEMQTLIARLINDSSLRSLTLTRRSAPNGIFSGDACPISTGRNSYASESGQVDWLSLRALFQACTRLRSLDISRCHLSYADWVGLIEGFENNQSVERLVVGGKGLFDLTVVNMLSALMVQLTNLREIDIKEAELSFFCVHRLMANAHACKGLESIRFENIRCPDSTLKLSQLLQSPHDDQTTLTHIAIVGYPLADIYEEHERLSVLLAVSSAHFLHSLDLTRCELSSKEIEALAEIIEHSASLEVLTLTGNASNESAQKWIEETLDRNRRIHRDVRQALENRAAVAYDLLLQNAPAVPQPWPPELSGVFAENSPTALLEALACGISNPHGE